ncbi:MAG TPA: uroporphyrinogen-III synthase [Rhizomicrobium sp.]|nr:uroporphyrinogen-III synthase [Rhizomicrobium sp.]
MTRPLEDGKEIARLLAQRGHQAVLAPLLEPRFLDGPPVELENVQALLASSANGIRAFVRRSARRDLPVFAVGPQTAKEAQDAGFVDVRSADGDAKALAEATRRWASPEGVLLHVCAEDAPGALAESLAADGFSVRRSALYAIEPARHLPPHAEIALRQEALDGVMFFSPRTARIFGALAHSLPTQRLTGFCISSATAQALTQSRFARILVAARPNQDEMLALVE